MMHIDLIFAIAKSATLVEFELLWEVPYDVRETDCEVLNWLWIIDVDDFPYEYSKQDVLRFWCVLRQVCVMTPTAV